jgi:hypothetical protein
MLVRRDCKVVIIDFGMALKHQDMNRIVWDNSLLNLGENGTP